MKTKERIACWMLTAGLALASTGLTAWLEVDDITRHVAMATTAVATCAGIALATELSGRRLFFALPSLAAPLLYGPGGSLVIWIAGGLVLLARIRGDEGRVKSGFISRRMLLRRVMDANFPDARAHLALAHGFAGPYEELRPAVAPVSSLPPSIALPVLSRLSLCPDSITRLTARKRMELMITALKEETDRPTPFRDSRHAALRVRKAEILLLLATWGSSDPDERRARLTEAAALAFVASDDFPSNDAYAAFAAGNAARVGEMAAAHRLHARIRDPRRAWSTGRLIRLCTRLTKPKTHGTPLRPDAIRTK